jgi:hypothetical protein
VSDPVIAYAVDEAVAFRMQAAESEAKSRRKLRGEIPAGQRYESVDEVLATAGPVH